MIWNVKQIEATVHVLLSVDFFGNPRCGSFLRASSSDGLGGFGLRCKGYFVLQVVEMLSETLILLGQPCFKQSCRPTVPSFSAPET